MKKKEQYLEEKVDNQVVRFYGGRIEWLLNEKKHRANGPAVERMNGDKEYWLYGEQISQNDYLATVKNISKDLALEEACPVCGCRNFMGVSGDENNEWEKDHYWFVETTDDILLADVVGARDHQEWCHCFFICSECGQEIS